MLLFLIAVLSVAGYGSAQNACDYQQTLAVGTTYYVYNDGYPNNYKPGSTCRWQAVSPAGYNCRLRCTEINIPQTPSCTSDRLMVSRVGDPVLANADNYCGAGTLDVVSTGNRMSIALYSNGANSAGGRFSCELTAVPETTTPAPNPTCNCGYGFKGNKRIVGGNATAVNEYPMMAGVIDTRTEHIYCGGTIIHPRYVLTAGHCLANIAVADLAVVAGEHNVQDPNSATRQIVPVADFLIHPQFNSANYDYDIALVWTAVPIRFSDRVGPACLPLKYASSDLAGVVVTALGWGTLYPGGPTANTLQKVNLNVISQNTCRSSYNTLTSQQMCTYSPGHDACQEDSGGPLIYTETNTNRMYAVGIISYGYFCDAGRPSVNTRITALLNWITTNTPDAQYCNI